MPTNGSMHSEFLINVHRAALRKLKPLGQGQDPQSLLIYCIHDSVLCTDQPVWMDLFSQKLTLLHQTCCRAVGGPLVS